MLWISTREGEPGTHIGEVFLFVRSARSNSTKATMASPWVVPTLNSTGQNRLYLPRSQVWMDGKKVRTCWLNGFIIAAKLNSDIVWMEGINLWWINSSVQDFLVQYNLKSTDLIFQTFNREIQEKPPRVLYFRPTFRLFKIIRTLWYRGIRRFDINGVPRVNQRTLGCFKGRESPFNFENLDHISYDDFY
jgi:hypothetical protein